MSDVTHSFHEAEARPTSAGPHELSPYRIVRMVGRGGMGVVYEAIHTGLDKRVALKALHVPRFGVIAWDVETGRPATWFALVLWSEEHPGESPERKISTQVWIRDVEV